MKRDRMTMMLDLGSELIIDSFAGGGAYTMVMRLPCIPISNRRGDVASVCKQFSEGVQCDEA